MRRLRRHASRWLAGFGVAAGYIAAASLGGGCSGTSPPEAGVPMPVGAYARVRVVAKRGADVANVLVSSRFVGFRGVDRTTADLLTGGDGASAPATGCAPAPAAPPYEDLVALIPDATQGTIEHLDAGEVTAIVDGVALPTAPTERPALAPYVAGLEYADGAAPIALPRGEVSVSGAGGSRVGAFEASAPLPPAIEAHATWGADLAITWAPPVATAQGAATTDRMTRGADDVTLTIAPERGPSAVVCRFADRGEAHVRADLLWRIASVSAGDPVTVVIDRARRVGFAAPGLSDGALEVVARDVITATAP